MRRVLIRLSWGLLALLTMVAIAFSVYAYRTQTVVDGTLQLSGLRGSVDVKRDASDVTHILASDPRDAWMAMGYVHAQERGWQMEFNRRIMRGTLSEVLGPATLDTDRTLRALGIHQAARAQLAGATEEARTALQAYSDGVNAFFAQRTQTLSPEFQVLGIDPREAAAAGRYWEPVDSAAWSLMMALDLGGNWGNEVARLTALQVLDTTALWELFPPYPGEAPAAKADLAKLYRDLGVFQPQVQTSSMGDEKGSWFAQGIGRELREWTHELGNVEGKGSNNWVVDGSRSASGKPLLANDPHLGLSAPAIWYFAHLKAPDVNGLKGMDAIGATLPGTPFVVLGRTPEVAWGFTNTGPDVQDLYLEQLHPQDPQRYRVPSVDGSTEPVWASFDTRTEVIRVKGQADEVMTVRLSRHGPVISDAPGRTHDLIDSSRYALALRWTALDVGNQNVQASLESNRVRTVDELIAAFRHFYAPMQNAVMADRTGRIAYKAVGMIPVRAPDNDIRGIAPSPGWESKYDWTGWVPYEATPEDRGEQGWISTANQRIHAPDYSYFVTQDWAPPYRKERIDAMLAQTPKHTLESFQAMHGDQLSMATVRLLPFLKKTPSSHPLAAAAQTALVDFDGVMDMNRAAPLIYTAWVDEFTRGVIGARLEPARFESLYGKRLFRNAVEGILERDDLAWCGATGCLAASTAALDRALDRLGSMQGRDVSAWQWGDAHPAISIHRPFSNVGALAPLFEVRTATGGDPFTVNVGQYHLEKHDAPFANRHAASLRAIYDLADPEKSVFIYQTGQSGNALSPRYRDMSEAWAEVGYRPLQMRPTEWRSSLVLRP
ncbi:penicillin acylase family protein [Hydrogenophaga sp. PAMC20947]|uniref:penicillin acylase family protein n=1 Tax=Hydrogenophaga sp. PAMC20947 TaxID=2565558 RepID=UPI00109D99EB|nr:penicillin acylase family protein [Hydrogenophaga sp. PAMC20947]QCB45540.1 penicillin acylase family protein [Hydrogenophaga sp. PAMC20947]